MTASALTETEEEHGAVDGPLDESCFRHFAPLLAASQGYARHSGCRFRANSFDGLEPPPQGASKVDGAPAAVAQRRARDQGPRLAAKVRAWPTVADFARRLGAGDKPLLEEVERAFRIVMVESVRNAMMGMFQALEMFPPRPAPAGVEDEDCAYEDLSAPLPSVAQRLYNDQVRRISNEGAEGFAGRLQRRAMTAAFLVDFAEVQGLTLPPVPDTQQSMLKELSTRVSEEADRRGADAEEQSRMRELFLSGLGAGAVGDGLREEARRLWAAHWRTVAAAAAGAAIFGVVGFAAAMVLSPARRRSEQEEERRRQRD